MAVVKESYGVEKHILIANNSYCVTLPALVSNSGVDADSDGKKILRAGTPLAGTITARGTAFTKTNGNTARAILLHDVDVTAGNNNATIILAGCVDLLKIDSTTRALITDNVKGAVPNIIFVEGSAI